MDDNVKKGYPFRETLQNVSAGGTNEDLTFGPVDAGDLVAVNGITVIDHDNNCTRVDILVGRIGVERVINTLSSLTAAVAGRLTDNFYLVDGERLLVRFVGSTTADRLQAVVEGEQRQHYPPVVSVKAD